MILASDMKKFSTREGKTISLVEVLNEAVVRAQKIIEEKNPKLSKTEKNKIAEVVGVGSVVYNDLSQNRMSDIAFDWDKVVSMEGNSAPYLQYTYTRLKGILKKAKLAGFDVKFLKEEREKKIILLLAEFPNVLEKVSQLYYPHYLADYLYALSKEANAFYQVSPVLNAEKGVKEARLVLINLIAENLNLGLKLLGVKTVERM
jgi:arginyl-tRNA synthetase